jgi:hypothetical protein
LDKFILLFYDVIIESVELGIKILKQKRGPRFYAVVEIGSGLSTPHLFTANTVIMSTLREGMGLY